MDFECSRYAKLISTLPSHVDSTVLCHCGSAASARQGVRKKSFDPSKGRMGGSSSDDDKERGTLNRLEPPEKIPRSNEGPQGENWTRVDLIVDSGASDSTLPFGVLPDHENGEARGYKEFSIWPMDVAY